VAKTGFRNDHFKPYLFKTTDYGRSWISIASNLPDYPINVIVQDSKNPQLLFAGTDNGLFISLDSGQNWQAFQNNMPQVKVTDLVVHPREGDLVVGTYGRGIWITNIWPLQELKPEVLKKEVHLFSVRPAVQREYPVFGNYELTGDNHLLTPNEPDELSIFYYLKEGLPEKLKIEVLDIEGNLLKELEGSGNPGLNQVAWDMRKAGKGRFRPRVEPGDYRLVLKAGDQQLEQRAFVTRRISWSFGPHPVVTRGGSCGED
jgi:hypothetical protein